MKNSNMQGVGTVFRYTVQQHYKNVSVIIFLAVLFVLSLAAFPFLKLQFGKEQVDPSVIKTLYLCNQTAFPISEKALASGAGFADLTVKEAEYNEEEWAELLNKESESAVAAVIQMDDAESYFTIRTYYGETGAVGNGEANELNRQLSDALHHAMMQALGVTSEQEDLLHCEAYAQVARAADYEAGAEESDTDTHVFANTFYGYLTMMLCALSMGYIFQLCMEEKTSKLVEVLLVSVSPTALLVGKILAVTMFIFTGLGLIVLGLFVSYQISGIGSGLHDVMEEAGKSMGFSFSGLHLTAGTCVLLAICLLIAYFTFAFFSGIVGSCCSKTEDTQQASFAVVLLMMLGYFSGTFSPMFENDAANYVLALCPITSVFTALPNYLCGKIGLPVFVLSLVLQLVAVVLLARLAGSVYRMMLLYRGNVPNPKQLFNMLRAEKNTRKAHAGKES